MGLRRLEHLPMAAGEIRDAKRNLPRATVIGMLAVLATYALVNVGYFHALPFSEVVTANSDKFPDAPAVAAADRRAMKWRPTMRGEGVG